MLVVQQQSLNLSLPWKFFLGLLFLVLLVVLKNPLYNLQPNKQQATPNVIHSQEIPLTKASLPSSAPVQSPAVNQLKITVPSNGLLNVRTQPAMSGRIITTVESGKVFEYSKTQNGWYKIVLPSDQEGWVWGKYVTKQ